MMVRKPVCRIGSGVVHLAMVPIGTDPGSVADRVDAQCGAALKGDVLLCAVSTKATCPRCLAGDTNSSD